MLELLHLYLELQKVDLDTIKVSIAVAQVETASCKAGVGRYNNCHGLRNGSIHPCKVSETNFCVFGSELESYVAFYKVWSQGYGGGLPTKEQAIRYTANPETDWDQKVNSLIK